MTEPSTMASVPAPTSPVPESAKGATATSLLAVSAPAPTASPVPESAPEATATLVASKSVHFKRVCAIATCKNPRDAHYFSFPKDASKQKLWLARCKRSDKVNTKNAKVCEIHFASEDYERDLKSELLGLPPKKRLKKDAAPTLQLPNPETPASDSKTGRKQRKLNREQRELVSSALASYEQVQLMQDEQSESFNDELDPNPIFQFVMKEKQVQCSVETETKQIQCDIKESYVRLEKEYQGLKKRFNTQKRALSQSMKKIKRLNSEKFKKQLLKTTLEKTCSKGQVKRIMSPTAKYIRGYSKEDVTTALVLKTINSRAFEYLRSKKLLALPSRFTLERFLNNFQCEPGFLDDSLKILQEKLKLSISSHEHYAVVCFDEMEVRRCYEVCARREKVFGPHKKMQVVMARGLTQLETTSVC